VGKTGEIITQNPLTTIRKMPKSFLLITPAVTDCVPSAFLGTGDGEKENPNFPFLENLSLFWLIREAEDGRPTYGGDQGEEDTSALLLWRTSRRGYLKCSQGFKV